MTKPAVQAKILRDTVRKRLQTFWQNEEIEYLQREVASLRSMLAAKEAENTALRAEIAKERRDSQEVIKL